MLAPLFLGGALQAQVRVATADQETALALFGQAALRAFSDVELSPEWCVNLDDALIERLREWLSPDSVEVVY